MNKKAQEMLQALYPKQLPRLITANVQAVKQWCKVVFWWFR